MDLRKWAYDAQGRLDEAEFPGSDPMDFTPLPDDALQTLERASGVTTSLVYHGQGPIDTLTVTAPGSTQLLALDYALNEVQNITGLDEQYLSSDPDEPYVFGYDGGNRLAGADYPAAYDLPADASYSYDPAGNREIPGSLGDYDYDANNRLTVSPFAALSCYDDDGNLTSRRSSGDCSTGPVVESFTWDHANRLRTFSKSGTSAAYAYDPFGRRIKKTVGSTMTWYVWDGDRLLAEYDVAGVRDARYAYAGGFAPVQVAYENGTSAGVYDVHSDHLDTPRMLTDASGAVAWRAAHEAFGAAALDSGNDVTFNVRFPGQYYDAESGLHQNRHRYYSPELGRYISGDPIGQYGSVNLYVYVENSPVNFDDPLGLFLRPPPAPGPIAPAVGAFAVGFAVGTAIEPAVRPYVDTAIDYWFGDPLAGGSGGSGSGGPTNNDPCGPDCDAQYATETATCNAISARGGRLNKARASRCHDSAVKRWAACNAGDHPSTCPLCTAGTRSEGAPEDDRGRGQTLEERSRAFASQGSGRHS